MLIRLLSFSLLLCIASFANDVKSKRLVIAKSIENKEPVSIDSSFSVTDEQIFCFSEITGVKGEQSFSHVFMKDGEEIYKRTFTVKAARWRTWSSKKIVKGEWSCDLVDESGTKIDSVGFKIAE